MNFFKSSTQPEFPSEAIALLEKYLKVAKAMIPMHDPNTSKDMTSATLWHPCLRLGDIFVDPESRKITSIIYWQSSAVLPLYYLSRIPPAFEALGPILEGAQLSELPHDYATLPQSERSRLDVMRHSEACQKFYEVETWQKNPRHSAALQHENLESRRRPTRLTVGLWETEKLFFLRKDLLEIKELWSEICPDSAHCPIEFSGEELAMYAQELENQAEIGAILRLSETSAIYSLTGY